MKKRITRKFWLKLMRFSITQSLVMALLAGVAYAHTSTAQEYLNRRLTVQAENREIKRVLAHIEKETDVQFVYSSNVLEASKKVTIKAVNTTLEEVLFKLLKPLKIKYELSGKKIILSAGELPGADNGLLLPEGNSLQTVPKKNLTGKVTDEKGAALPGVNIIVKGTPRGTTTNSEGAFQIDL